MTSNYNKMSVFIKKVKPFIVIAITVVLLIFLSFINTDFKIAGIQLKNVNLFSGFNLSKQKESEHHTFSRDSVEISTINIDTLLSLYFNFDMDSIVEMEKKDLRISTYNKTGDIFAHFFPALKSVQDSSGKTRIAYFGDSMIEGDLISQSLRNDLQRKFGGKGVGFVPITSIVSQFRRTIKHEFSNEWKEYSILKSHGNINFSPAGFLYNPRILSTQELNDTLKKAAVSSVKYYAPPDVYPGLSEFYLTELFYGKAKKSTFIKYYIDNKEHKTFLEGTEIVNTLTLNTKKPYKELVIEFYTDSILDVFGVSFESNNGIFVDNFAVRGNLGMALQKIPENILKSFNNYMNYSLLIFQFGLNVAAPETRNFSWYENTMVNVVNYYREIIPNADVLIISIGDKSIRKDMKHVTQPNIPILAEAQRNIAKRTGSAFWNLFQAMGGYNSMVSWVEAQTPLASKDYAHINFRGAEKISDMLAENFINEFKLFEYGIDKKEQKEILKDIITKSRYAYLNKYGSFKKTHLAVINNYLSIIPPRKLPIKKHHDFVREFDKYSVEKKDGLLSKKLIAKTLPKKPTETLISDELAYGVQILECQYKLPKYAHNFIKTKFPEKEIIAVKTNDGLFRYFISFFTDKDNADQLLSSLTEKGFKGNITSIKVKIPSPLEKVSKKREVPKTVKKATPPSQVFISLPTRRFINTVGFENIHFKKFIKNDTLSNYITNIHYVKVVTEKAVEDNLPKFRVQFMASLKPLGKEYYTHIIDMYGENKIIISHDPDGYIRYMLGDYATYQEATEVLNKLTSINQQAFITGWYENKRITTEKANSIINKNKNK